ncbi:MAG: dGTPase [Candidatus Peregrinibacteria bacterium Greene0416_62]|nr:MAG: dGTPase [Candidatus Peregrinibacteria bacterium Greene0416_62]TSC99923.1 MAG: dGTPase [Candidatus Peregrinibacteria bacterium Greene1014_49]
MESLSKRIQAANALLAPYAVPHEGLLGRVYPEPEDDTRFPFQRDRDRIIHTQAFRRLKGKTQVFVAGTHDHVRTRLTHTMEVAQISRDIARSLGLNEDLAEAIALSHDLGHPPFGHSGEEALDQWMKNHGGSFEHNEQSHRVVTVLAEHSTLFPGLNLNQEILEGILKHKTPHDPGVAESRGSPLRQPTLEAQIVNLSDEIAYTGHDCEDGIRAGLFTQADIMAIPLAEQAFSIAMPRGTSLRGAIIHILVTDLLKTTETLITDQSVHSLEDVLRCAAPLAQFSVSLKKELSALRDFLWNRMYLHPDVLKCSHEGQMILSQLCEQYLIKPPSKVRELQQRTVSALEEAVKDYVAGMTDKYAADQLHRA